MMKKIMMRCCKSFCRNPRAKTIKSQFMRRNISTICRARKRKNINTRKTNQPASAQKTVNRRRIPNPVKDDESTAEGSAEMFPIIWDERRDISINWPLSNHMKPSSASHITSTFPLIITLEHSMSLLQHFILFLMFGNQSFHLHLSGRMRATNQLKLISRPMESSKIGLLYKYHLKFKI